MMKTPEEIKKGLDICSNSARCRGCPYLVYVEGSFGCHEMGCEDDLLPDALAYIQQLEARVPRWIPVEERLPDCRVLAINDRGVVAVGKIGQFYDRGENVYVCDEWDSNIGIIHVTHWMPLPEPPEEVRHE